MIKRISPTAAPGIRRIAVNGHCLDELRTRLQNVSGSSALSYIQLPVERHEAAEDAQGVTLAVPTLTALQLFGSGILSSDRSAPVKLTIAGRDLSWLYLHWFRVHPGGGYGDHVLLRFERQPGTVEAPDDPRAWLTSLVPLELLACGEWDPSEEYWGEDGEPVEAWAIPIIKRGIRPMFEMEQVLPGADPEDFDSDPILQANELKEQGKVAKARKLLEKLLIKDMRCLDAHAHLGNLVFDQDARLALAHYERGVQIGELSLGEKFEGVLPWGLIDNRPFLRCLHGYGFCLWRLKRFEEAEAVFNRLLWLSPSDNLGLRFVLPRVREREPWTPE